MLKAGMLAISVVSLKEQIYKFLFEPIFDF
jgi:hypothetical protein